MKNIKHYLYLILAICVGLGSAATAQNRVGDWQAFTQMLSVRGIATDGSLIYAATNGGLLLFNPATEFFNEITNIDGLSHTNLNDIVKDQNGRFWLATGKPDGDINVWDPENGIYNIITLGDQSSTISSNKLAVYNNQIFGSATRNINPIVVEYTRQENGDYFYKDFYDQFPDGVGRINNLLVFKDRIYLATDAGLVRSALLTDNPNLKTPGAWELLPLGNFNAELSAMAAVGDVLYFSAGNQLWKYDTNIVTPVDPGFSTGMIYTLNSTNGELYLGTRFGVYYQNHQGEWNQIGTTQFPASALTIDANGKLWAGTSAYGIASFLPDSSAWRFYKPNCPIDNQVNSMTVDNDGRLIAANINGISILENDGWFNILDWSRLSNTDREFLVDQNQDANYWREDTLSYRSAPVYDMAVDSRNNLYVSHEGAGVLRLNLDDITDYETYDTTNGDLSGSQGIGDGAPNFIVTRGIALDQQENLWIANAFAANGNAIAVKTPDGTWIHYNLFDSEYPNPLNLLHREISVDDQNRIWISSQLRNEAPHSNGGIIVLDYGASLTDKNDDQWFYVDQENNLSGMDIQSITITSSNRVYAITNGETRVQSFQIPANLSAENDIFFSAGNTETFLTNFGVASVYSDLRDNLWFTTSGNGVKLMESSGSIFQRNGVYGYTSGNSNIMSNSVISITSDPKLGTFYFATDLGISALTTESATPRKNFSKIYTFPSPYYIPNNVSMVITELPDEVEVKILTLNGEVIRTLTPQDGDVRNRQAFWDGRDSDGDLVGSGVYFFYCYTQDGKTETTKALVIKK